MKERPILMSAPMVRAALAGTKTQTRRAVKWRGLEPGLNLQFSGLEVQRSGSNWVLAAPTRTSWAYRSVPMPCPYGVPGDRLYVRETWKLSTPLVGTGLWPFYRATCHELDRDAKGWKPSIHMPRKYSRILLEVTGVRVERLQSIDYKDAEAEGVARLPLQDGDLNSWWTADVSAGLALHSRSAIGGYHKLWNSINGAGSWEANPWVWCVSFRRLTP